MTDRPDSRIRMLNNNPNLTHGLSNTPEYRTWTAVITRCYNKNFIKYKNYGGRGIVMCDRWRSSFENFIEDMGPKPTPEHSLDRLDNNKGYYKDNCRWATPKEQSRNRRNNSLFEFEGKTFSLSELAENYNISYKTLWDRVNLYRWDLSRALTTPVRSCRRGLYGNS